MIIIEIKEKSTQTINDLKEFRIKISLSDRKPYYRAHPELSFRIKKVIKHTYWRNILNKKNSIIHEHPNIFTRECTYIYIT